MEAGGFVLHCFALTNLVKMLKEEKICNAIFSGFLTNFKSNWPYQIGLWIGYSTSRTRNSCRSSWLNWKIIVQNLKLARVKRLIFAVSCYISLSEGVFLLSLNFYLRTQVNFTRVNWIKKLVKKSKYVRTHVRIKREWKCT